MVKIKTVLTVIFIVLLTSCIATSSVFIQAASTSTFGNTETGGTGYSAGTTQTTTTSTSQSSNAAANTVKASSIVPTSDGVISQVGVNVRTAAGDIMLAIYADSGGSPGALLAYSSASTAVTGWMDLTLNTPISVVAGTTYWLAYSASNTGLAVYRAYGGSVISVSNPYGSFPDPFGTGSSTANQLHAFRIVYSSSLEGSAYATQASFEGLVVGVQSLNFYAHATGDFRVALYTDNGEEDSPAPGTLLWESASTTATVGWNTVTIASGTPSSLASLQPGTYWLAFQWDSANAGPSQIVDMPANTGNYITMAYGAFPATWTAGTSTTNQWSIYAAFNILAVITPTPMPTAPPDDSSTTWTENREGTPLPTEAPEVDYVTAVLSSDGSTFTIPVAGTIAASQISSVTVTPSEADQATVIFLTVTGPSGGEGFANMTIPKQAIAVGTTPMVYIDGAVAENQGYTEDASNYYVWYTTHFSTHDVTIVFSGEDSSTPTSDSGLDITVIAAAGIVVALVIIVALVLVFRAKRKK